MPLPFMRLRFYCVATLCLMGVVLAGMARASAADPPPVITISLVATTDLHGHIESLPWLGGHLANLRAQRRADGGAVLLVDAGDMFQGTLESNLVEGAVVVRGYNALGYAAAAIGNHEFDFGPVGRDHVVSRPGGDPRGALKARAREARFPFLAGNLLERQGPSARDGRPRWANVRPWTVVESAGVRIGIVGGTTEATPRATHPLNFTGLGVDPLPDAMARGAREARAAGASLVVVVVHAGGVCQRQDAPEDLASCQPDEEVFSLARALPAGLVDAIAAGHTHRGVAHRVAGIPIVQAHAEGKAFGRIDLEVDRGTGRLVASRIHPPRGLCTGSTAITPVPSFEADACRPLPYEGRPVSFDVALAKVIAADVKRAASERSRRIGPIVRSPVWRSRTAESPLGNLAADLMRAAVPGADLAFINGGTLRTDLPAGPLTYGQLFQSFPFDDGLVRLRLPAATLGQVMARNLQRSGGILSISGLRAIGRCQDGELTVEWRRPDGGLVPPATPLVAVTIGYLANGGDGLLEPQERPRAPDGRGPPAETRPMRELFADLLASRARRAGGGELGGDDRSLFDESNRRVEYPGQRPVRCGRERAGRR